MIRRLPNAYAPINIDVEGDLTHTRWIGTFQVKRILTWKDRFEIERYYKEYLQDDSSVKDPMIIINASALAELRARIQSGPPWWEATSYGLDLIDNTPIHTLMAELKRSTTSWDKELSEMVKEPPKAT